MSKSHTRIFPKSDEKSSEPVSTEEAEQEQAKKAHHERVLQHVNNGDTESAFQALMTDHNGRQLDYEESRGMYG